LDGSTDTAATADDPNGLPNCGPKDFCLPLFTLQRNLTYRYPGTQPNLLPHLTYH
jgi:hypothetical protein